MARIIGGIGATHVPSIGLALAQGLQEQSYWKPFFDGFHAVRAWLARRKPDVAVVFYNDHGLNFFLDTLPTFAVGAAPEYRNADEGWGLPVSSPFRGAPGFSWHLIESLVADEFDLATCQEMMVDHAFTLPMKLLWPGDGPPPVAAVPISINTVQHPLPSAHRCLALGRAVRRAVESYPKDLKVVVIGTGGLSHQLDGTRAGFINRDFDNRFLDMLPENPDALTSYSSHDLVRLCGSQGVEVLMWLAMRGALGAKVGIIQRNYHVPISNTASAVLALETA